MASRSKPIITWVGGILATVISSVLIYYLTLPKAPPPPSPSSIQIEGRVIDLSAKSLITGARVTLRAGGYSGSQLTDSLGRYGFDVPLAETTEATFVIEATGYPRYSVNSTLKKLSEAQDDALLPLAAAPNPVPPAGNAPPGNTPPPNPKQNAGAVLGALGGGGKGAAIGAAAGAGAGTAGAASNSGQAGQGAGGQGAVVGHEAIAAKPAANPAVLAPYVRRPDFVRIEAVKRVK